MCIPQIKNRKTKVSGLFNTTPVHPSLHVVWCPSSPSKSRILYPVVFCQMLADTLQPLGHSAPALPPEPSVWGQLSTFCWMLCMCMAWQSSLPVSFKWYSRELCRRINWNFPCQSLGANTISDWRWCQRDACVFMVASGDVEYTLALLGLYGQHVAFGQR